MALLDICGDFRHQHHPLRYLFLNFGSTVHLLPDPLARHDHSSRGVLVRGDVSHERGHYSPRNREHLYTRLGSLGCESGLGIMVD